MAIMRTNRLTSKTTNPPKKRTLVPASELEARDAAYKVASENYGKQMETYNKQFKGARDYSQFAGGVTKVSKAGLAEYNKNRPSYEPEVIGIERAKGLGTEAEYLKKVSLSEKNQNVANIGHVTYKKPTAPAPPGGWEDVQLDKMPTKKATLSTPKGKLRDISIQEFSEFEAPKMSTKNKTKRALTGGGESGLTRAGKTGGSLKAAQRVTGEKTVGSRAYKKEKQQFEAFSNPLPSGGRLDVFADTSPSIKRDQASAKGLAKEYRKEGNREGAKMMRQEASQLGKAAKFADKMYERGRGDYFTRDMVKGYRSSSANPANQNTIKRQEELLNMRKK